MNPVPDSPVPEHSDFHDLEMSKEMLQYFSAPMTLPHPGGHFIPASAAQKHVYHSFLEVMLSKKTAMEL